MKHLQCHNIHPNQPIHPRNSPRLASEANERPKSFAALRRCFFLCCQKKNCHSGLCRSTGLCLSIFVSRDTVSRAVIGKGSKVCVKRHQDVMEGKDAIKEGHARIIFCPSSNSDPLFPSASAFISCSHRSTEPRTRRGKLQSTGCYGGSTSGSAPGGTSSQSAGP